MSIEENYSEKLYSLKTRRWNWGGGETEDDGKSEEHSERSDLMIQNSKLRGSSREQGGSMAWYRPRWKYKRFLRIYAELTLSGFHVKFLLLCKSENRSELALLAASPSHSDALAPLSVWVWPPCAVHWRATNYRAASSLATLFRQPLWEAQGLLSMDSWTVKP